MPKIFPSFAAAATLMLVTSAAPSKSPLISTSDAQELAGLLATDRAWLSSYGNRDPAAFDRTWTDDAVLVTTFGSMKSRAAERRDAYETPSPPEVTEEKFTVSEQQARRYGDAAVVIGRFTNTGRWKGTPFTRSWRYSSFYVRASGNWKLVSTHFSPIAEGSKA